MTTKKEPRDNWLLNSNDVMFVENKRRAFAGRRGAGIRHTPESKNYSIKNLIESSEIFETNKEFLQSVIDGVLTEKAAKIEQEKFKLESERAAKIEQEKFKLESEKAKIEFEKIKLEQLKKELELTNANVNCPLRKRKVNISNLSHLILKT
ncbi:hypothetical protein TNCV_465281 [Trichonephila clavipes]|nr:hypothetical protein TNCV_465281 [Trichonephila clavipes]